MRQPIEEKNHPAGGVQKRYRFKNGYGASVVRTPFSYGGAEGLWELAVIQYNEDKILLTYDTPITDDVIGYLTDDDVDKLLSQIEAL